jgi:hypothetical protein
VSAGVVHHLELVEVDIPATACSPSRAARRRRTLQAHVELAAI